MTLIMSTKGKHVTLKGKREADFIVLGCDSRGVIEISDIIRTESNSNKKLFKLNDYCCIMLAGDAEFGITLINGFIEKSSLKGKGVSEITEEFRKFCIIKFNEIQKFSLENQKLFPDVDFIVSGMDKEGKEFKKGRIFILRKERLFTPSFSDDFASSGQTLLAYYFFEKQYREDLTLDESLQLVGQAIYDTARINGNVGGKITLAVIDSKKFRIVDEQEYIKGWEQEKLDRLVQGPSS